MAWLMLVMAGVLEIIWSVSMKQSAGFTRPVPTIITLITVVGSFVLLSAAMRTLPLGTAYAVWTGIGVIGAFVLGIFYFNEAVSVQRIAAVILIIAGMALMRLSHP